MSENKFLLLTIPLITTPFTLLSIWIFIFVSFNRREILLSLNFKNTSENSEVRKVEFKNADIKLMVNTFMLTLLSIEIVHNILVTISYGLNYTSNKPRFWDTNCTIENTYILTLLRRNGWILLSPIDISYSSSTLLLSIITLLLKVLKRRYLNLPYKKIITNNIIFIVLRFSFLVLLFSSPYTYYLALVLKFTCIFDLFSYIFHSNSFYSLLKQRTIEAKWHSDSRDFREKYRACNQYYYSWLFCVFIFSIFTAEQFLLCVNGFLDIFMQNTCLLSHYTLGYIQEVNFDPQTQRILSIFHFSASITEFILGVFHQISTSLAYLIVFIAYAMHFWKKKYFHFNLNEKTQVYMAAYNQTVLKYTMGFP